MSWSSNTYDTSYWLFQVGYALSGSENSITWIATSTIHITTGGPGSASKTVSGSSATPAGWYHIVLKIVTPLANKALTTTSSSYLSYAGTLVPENLLPLLILAPIIPLIIARRTKKAAASQREGLAIR